MVEGIVFLCFNFIMFDIRTHAYISPVAMDFEKKRYFLKNGMYSHRHTASC